jgi:predicted DNA-binding WGR domain protein
MLIVAWRYWRLKSDGTKYPVQGLVQQVVINIRITNGETEEELHMGPVQFGCASHKPAFGMRSFTQEEQAVIDRYHPLIVEARRAGDKDQVRQLQEELANQRELARSDLPPGLRF